MNIKKIECKFLVYRELSLAIHSQLSLELNELWKELFLQSWILHEYLCSKWEISFVFFSSISFSFLNNFSCALSTNSGFSIQLTSAIEFETKNIFSSKFTWFEVKLVPRCRSVLAYEHPNRKRNQRSSAVFALNAFKMIRKTIASLILSSFTFLFDSRLIDKFTLRMCVEWSETYRWRFACLF